MSNGRLLLFAGRQYYPKKGVLDYKGCADNSWDLKDLYASLDRNGRDWGMIVRRSDMYILETIIENDLDEEQASWEPGGET